MERLFPKSVSQNLGFKYFAVYSFVLIMAFFWTIWSPSAFGDEGYYYGHKVEVKPSKPKLGADGLPLPDRLVDNGNGTITDLKESLMWKARDSYQEKKKWLNWHDAQKYIEEMNKKKFAGHSDWRLPLKKELKSLYEEDKEVPWKYYWTENVVHIDPIFGDTSCCFWTSEEYKEKYAYGFNFIRGQTYLSLKGGIMQSLTVIRPVRTIEKLASK